MSEPEPPPPRVFEAAGPVTDRRGTTLTPELEAAAARRLGALALVVSVLGGTLGLSLHLGGAHSFVGSGLRLGLVGMDSLMSLALFAAIKTGRLAGARALRVGFVYQIAHAFLASVVFHAMTLVPGVEGRGWTPVAVWAVVFPLIVPTRPRNVWLPTLLTAAMDPLGLWVAVAAGAPSPSAAARAQLFLPTVLVCIIAPVAATIVYGLTVEVKRAREMGSYRLVEKLGQGGMGEVWRAEHRMLARSAAIKLIRPAALGGVGSQSRELMRRFEREARATAALRSPHTIVVYDYGVAADGTFHYVMELLEGFSLQALVERFGPLPPERAVHLLRQACHSLAEAHGAGLIHRDVKPANLFACRLGLDLDFVKVLDFGLVKLRGPQADGAEALTMEGAFTGTPGFMPPEVALGATPIDGRADIYALGCVAYWLLTGRRVFENANVMQTLVDHIRTAPVPPSQRTDQPIPEELERLVLRCLEKDPGSRPGTAHELSAELQGLGLEERWTSQRMRGWWDTHHPAAGQEASSPTQHLDSADQARSALSAGRKAW